jgi:COMPASS component SWD3
MLHKIQEYGSVFLSLDYSKDGNLFAVGGEDKVLRIYDEDMKILTSKFLSGSNYTPGHKSRINSVCFHKNDSTGNYSNVLVSGGWDQRVIIYDTRTNKICGTVFGPYICGDSLDLRDHLLLTGSFYPDSNMELWDLRNYKLYDAMPLSKTTLSSNIYTAQFSKISGSSHIGTGSSSSNSFRVYEIDMNNPIKNIEMSPYVFTRYLEKPCYSLDFANRHSMIAFGGGEGNIRVVNL